MLTDYTTYDDIRAALGVSADDIEDSTLALTLYEDILVEDLEDVSASLPATYQVTKALGTKSDDQTRFLRACRTFAAYAVAKHLTASLPLFAAKQVGDGKASVQRFDNPYADTIKQVNSQYGKARSRVQTALSALSMSSGSTVTRQYFAVVSPSTDPVTGS